MRLDGRTNSPCRIQARGKIPLGGFAGVGFWQQLSRRVTRRLPMAAEANGTRAFNVIYEILSEM